MCWNPSKLKELDPEIICLKLIVFMTRAKWVVTNYVIAFTDLPKIFFNSPNSVKVIPINFPFSLSYCTKRRHKL